MIVIVVLLILACLLAIHFTNKRIVGLKTQLASLRKSVYLERLNSIIEDERNTHKHDYWIEDEEERFESSTGFTGVKDAIKTLAHYTVRNNVINAIKRGINKLSADELYLFNSAIIPQLPTDLGSDTQLNDLLETITLIIDNTESEILVNMDATKMNTFKQLSLDYCRMYTTKDTELESIVANLLNNAITGEAK